MPLRKKFDLCVTENHFYARAPKTTEPVQGTCYAWKDIGKEVVNVERIDGGC